MKLIEGCFGNVLEKYFKYYKYICKEIKCKNSNDAQITKESEVGDIFRYIFMYIVGILCAIYLYHLQNILQLISYNYFYKKILILQHNFHLFLLAVY